MEKIGDQYIRGPDGKIPLNSDQISKLYLENKENNEGFTYMYKGEGNQSHDS